MEDLLEAELANAKLSPADRGLCQELVYGTTRWLATLDWLIARKTLARQPRPNVRNLLRLGLYQIFWLDRIPDHAAVHETVELAKCSGLNAQAGFINAVLRGCLREHDSTATMLVDLKNTQPHLGYSHPQWLADRWSRRWGRDKAAQLMEWNNTPPKVFARVNGLKVSAEELLAVWGRESVQFKSVSRDWLPEGIVFELLSHPPLESLESFRRGWFYVQDPSTLLAPRLLNPQPGETVLDLCAAPGGKLTYMAQLMKNQGAIVASDSSADRLKLAKENCARLGLKNVEYSKFTSNSRQRKPRNAREASVQSSRFKVQRSMFPSSPHARRPSPLYDRILIDAPCSNTGVMRRRVELRWRIRPEEIRRLHDLQLALLHQAAPLLKPGGVLVFSTCSLEPEENEEVIKEFLADRPEFKPVEQHEMLPFLENVDGAYAALLING